MTASAEDSGPVMLVDDLWSAAEDKPYATIAEDTRPVLRAPTRHLFHSDGKPAPTPSSNDKLAVHTTLSFEHPLPPDLRSVESFLVVPRARRNREWSVLSPFVLPMAPDSASTVRFDVDFPFESEQTPWLTLYPLSTETARDSIETRAPVNASLEFAIGVLEPWQQIGPVEFVIEACRAKQCEPIFTEIVPARTRHGEATGWLDRRVSLAPYGGKKLELRFTFRAADEGQWTPLAFFADPTLHRADAPRAEGPNVLLISIDTLRADHVGAYGYKRPTTPFIDKHFEAHGTVFEECVAASSSTLPSHMTMLTSLVPAVHGARNTKPNVLPKRAVLLAEWLREHGFATAAVTENGAVSRVRGFGRGFATYREVREKESRDHDRNIEATFGEGLEVMRALRDRRFFVFLHTYKPHNPYEPPEGYRELFGDVDPGFEKSKRFPDWTPLRYDREIRYIDDQVRDLFASLEREGLLENTLVVFTSDHGEAFLEHGFFAHGALVWEEVLQVPMMLSGPGIPKGLRVQEPVGLLDLMPSMLELLAIDPPAGLMGQSFRSLMVDTGKTWKSRPIFSEATVERAMRPWGATMILQPTIAVRDGDLKLIRFRTPKGFQYRLFDLAKDPGEQNNLIKQKALTAGRMKKLIADYESSSKLLRERLQEDEAENVPLDPAETDMLRALGYIE